ncbi:MAG: oligosaccharide flippase family protein, partial [Acidobacteriaceae bacterium]|nr:oligosaccharide flippase family protein [Acidobacteriaceae bacterium]
MRVSESEGNGPAAGVIRSGFVRLQNHAQLITDVGSVYGVQFANYALPLVTVPYLTRVLGPSNWGLIAMAQAFALYGNLIVEYGFIYSGTRRIATAALDKEVEEIVAGVSAAKILLSLVVLTAAALAYALVPLFHEHPLLLWAAVSAEIVKASLPNYYFYGIKRIGIASLLDISARTGAAAGIFFVVHGPEDAWKFF